MARNSGRMQAVARLRLTRLRWGLSRTLVVLTVQILSLWACPGFAAGLGVMSATGATVDERAVSNVAVALRRPSTETSAHPIPAPAGDWWVAGLTLTECLAASEVDLAAVALDAKRQLSNLDSTAAATALDRAIVASPCSGTVVKRADLLLALELLAQAAQDEGETERARTALSQLLSADSSYQLSSPPGSGYEELWNDVRRDVGRVQPVRVAVQHVGEVFLDGAAVPAEWTLTAPLLPGPHLLQWRRLDVH